MHAKGSGAHGTFTVTHDIARYTKAKIFSQIGKQTPSEANCDHSRAGRFVDWLKEEMRRK